MINLNPQIICSAGTCTKLNLACVSILQTGEQPSDLSITAPALLRHHQELKHIQVSAGFLLRPPRFLDAPRSCSVPPPPPPPPTSTHPRKARQGKTARKRKEKLRRESEKGTSTLRRGRLVAKARRIPCLHPRCLLARGPALPPECRTDGRLPHAYVRGGTRPLPPPALPTCRSVRA